MNIKVAGLALLPVIGIGVAVTACSSASGTANPAASATASASGATVATNPASASAAASAATSSSPASVPAGDKRIGGAAQGISLAVPASWTAMDLSKLSATTAASKITVGSKSNAALVQEMQSLQKLHAVVVWDLKSVASTPQQFARNLNAYCFQAEGVAAGAAGVPEVKSGVASALGSQGATHLTQQDLTIGGMPGVETSYQLTTSVSGKFYGSQLTVVPKPGEACSVTESWGVDESSDNVLGVAAATAEFP